MSFFEDLTDLLEKKYPIILKGIYLIILIICNIIVIYLFPRIEYIEKVVYEEKIVYEEVIKYVEKVVYEEPNYILYSVSTSAYCGEDYPHTCNNGSYNITATGTIPKVNHTIAVDPTIFPYGSKIEIDNIIYTAEDTGGGFQNGTFAIDIFFETHAEALEYGRKQKIVKLYQQEGNHD